MDRLGGGRAEPVFWPSNGILIAALVLGSRRLAPWAVVGAVASWWAGDAVGLLLVGATLIAFGPGTRHEGRRPRASEWAIMRPPVAALSALPLVTGDRPLDYLPLPAMGPRPRTLGARSTRPPRGWCCP